MMRRFLSLFLILLLLTGTVFAAGANKPKVIDHADLLTEAEERTLEEAAQQLVDTFHMDVVILTVDSLGGKTAEKYADDYYDNNGYGLDEQNSGILLLLSMEARDWAISTTGECIDIFSDSDLDSIFHEIAPALSRDDYYNAFNTYIDQLEIHFWEHDDSATSIIVDILFNLVVSLIIGAVVSGIVLLVLRGQMNTARAQSSASYYLVDGSFHMYRQQDIYLYSHTSKVRRQQSSSGSSTHRGSSGTSHGGRSGKF